MASAESLAGTPQRVRVPKLAYRNPLPADQISLSSQDTSSSETPSAEPFAELRLSTPTSIATSSPIRPSFDSRSNKSASLASTSDSNASTSKGSKTSKKKKPNAMLGFLTLKEPSQSALEQFAEQQRKQAAEKAAKPGSASSSTFAPQKLPPTVPKVNSKWDGIPKAVKARESAAGKSKRNSTSTQATSRLSSIPNQSIFSLSSDGTCNPPNSLASPASSVTSFGAGPLRMGSERRDSGPSLTEHEKFRSHMSSPSTTSLPEMTYFFPDEPKSPIALPGSSEETTLASTLAATTPATSPSTSTPTSSQLQTQDNPVSVDVDESTVIALTTPPILPHPQPIDGTADNGIATYRRGSLQGFLAGEAQEVDLPDDDEDVVSGSHDFLFELQKTTTSAAYTTMPVATAEAVPRPSAMNFSRPLSSQSASSIPDFSRISVAPEQTALHRPGFSGLPTLYEASVISSTDTNDTLDTVVDLPNLDDRVKDSDTISIAPSVTSVTPSEMSASWYQSPRERLGLGGRIRKSDVIPWDSVGELQPGPWQARPTSPAGAAGSGAAIVDGPLWAARQPHLAPSRPRRNSAPARVNIQPPAPLLKSPTSYNSDLAFGDCS